MRVLALIIAAIGGLLIGVGAYGLHTTVTGWDILGRSGALMGLQPDHWRGHWLGTAGAYIVLGAAFVCFAIGLWRYSRRVATAWCFTVTALSALSLVLFLLHPLPYGFQQVSLGEVVILTALSAVSWLVARGQQHAKTI